MYSSIQLVEPPQLGALLGEGADHPDAGEILLHAAGDVARTSPESARSGVDRAAEDDHGDAHQRAREDREKRQPPVHLQP